MKTLNVELARSIWLFSLAEMNPDGLDFRSLLESITTEYLFANFSGSKVDHTSEPGFKFRDGRFTLESGDEILIRALTIYTDGIVADTIRSTEATDQFLTDLMDFVRTKGYYFDPSMLIKKAYLSELTLESDIELENASSKFGDFSLFLDSLLPDDAGFKIAGFGFNSAPATTNTTLQFRFERKVGRKFTENRYFSQAPFKTRQHQEALEKLEALLRL